MFPRRIHQSSLLLSYTGWFVFCFASLLVAQTKTGHVDHPISSPIFVNLYWDSTWDADNPTLKSASIDGVTLAIVNSSYIKGLAEYGVVSASFGGGFLPTRGCPAKAPASVGFYDPVNTSIAGFIQCEHDHGPAILRQNSVINGDGSQLLIPAWSNTQVANVARLA